MNTEQHQTEIDRLKLRYARAVLNDPEGVDTYILRTCLMDVILIDLVGRDTSQFTPEDIIKEK